MIGIQIFWEFVMCINVPGWFECECEPGYFGNSYMFNERGQRPLPWHHNPAFESRTCPWGLEAHRAGPITITLIVKFMERICVAAGI